jgi:hypothetical protein
VLEDHGITTSDVLEQWLERGLNTEGLYLPCDGHWSEAGHRAAFDVILPVVGDTLQRAKLVQRAPTQRPNDEELAPSAGVRDGRRLP